MERKRSNVTNLKKQLSHLLVDHLGLNGLDCFGNVFLSHFVVGPGIHVIFACIRSATVWAAVVLRFREMLD